MASNAASGSQKANETDDEIKMAILKSLREPQSALDQPKIYLTPRGGISADCYTKHLGPNTGKFFDRILSHKCHQLTIL